VIKLILLVILTIYSYAEEPTELHKVAQEENRNLEAIHECVDKITPELVRRNSKATAYEICTNSLEGGVDPMLVVSIGIVESSLRGNCFGNEYNIFCIRRHDNFYDSYNDSVRDVVALIRDSGQTDPRLVGKWYCPPTADEWANDVIYLMEK